MGLLTIEGIYENGRIQLMETPTDVQKARVMVTFLPKDVKPDEPAFQEALRQKFMQRLRKGVDFGTEPLPTREELYADRLDRCR